MSKLSEYIKNNKDAVYSFASRNTPIDNAGRPVILKSDEWATEAEWNELYESEDE